MFILQQDESDTSTSGVTIQWDDYMGSDGVKNSVDNALVEITYTYTDIDGETHTITYTTVSLNNDLDNEEHKNADTALLTPVGTGSVTIETELGSGDDTYTVEDVVISRNGPLDKEGTGTVTATFTFNYDKDEWNLEGINNENGVYNGDLDLSNITGIFGNGIGVATDSGYTRDTSGDMPSTTVTGEHGHIIYNVGEGSDIGTISAAFINETKYIGARNGSTSVPVSDENDVYGGSAIYNRDGATIESINGSYFIGNTTIEIEGEAGGDGADTGDGTTTTENSIRGGVILNYSYIGDITDSYFIGNSMVGGTNSKFVTGGVIDNRGGTIEIISGCYFIGNTISTTYPYTSVDDEGNEDYATVSGAAIDNATANGVSGHIGVIENTYFIGNKSEQDNSSGEVRTGNNVNGGAITNGNGCTIDLISGSYFIGNETHNGGAIQTGGNIGELYGNYFIGNEVSTTSADGGAIYISKKGSIGYWVYDDGSLGYFSEDTFIDAATGEEVVDEYTIVGVSGGIVGNYFYGNSAVRTGGAIVNESGHISNMSGNVFMQNISTGSGVNSGGETNYNHAGGAFTNYKGAVTSNISGNWFIENQATRGGAIMNDRDSEITNISDNWFIGNIGNLYGGAIYNYQAGMINTLSDNWFIENVAEAGNGGAVENAFAYSCIGGIDGNYFIGNKAYANPDNENTGWGGAIYNEGHIGSYDSLAQIHFVSDSNLDIDVEIIVDGDGISNSYFIGNWAENKGGAIFNRYNEDEGTAANITNISGSYFIENESVRGGAIYNDEHTVIGGYHQVEIVDENGDPIPEGEDTTGGISKETDTIIVTGGIDNSYFIGNKASMYGGAIYNDNGGMILSITNSYFQENVAEGGNGGAIENGYYESLIGVISGNTFYKNSVATGDHGGAAIYSEGIITSIEGNTFVENTAGNFGGAIYNNGGEIGGVSDLKFVDENGDKYPDPTGGIVGNYFEGNTADRGGAIYNTKTRTIVTVTDEEEVSSQIQIIDLGDNSYGEIMNIDGNTFVNNVGNDYAGAIYNYHSASIGSISNNYFSGNRADDGNGGAVENAEFDASIGTMDGNVFVNNTASRNGGAIYNQGTIGIIRGDEESGDTVNVAISNSTFIGNTAQNGGAIYNNYTTSYTTMYVYSTDETRGYLCTNGYLVTDSSIVVEGDTLTYDSSKIDTDANGNLVYKTDNGDIFVTKTEVTNEDGEVTSTTYTPTYVVSLIPVNGAGAIGEIQCSYFEGNQATSGSGGAIYIASGTVKDENGDEVTDETTEEKLTYTATIGKITNTSFVNNSATDVGGAIYSASDLTIAADGDLSGSTVLIQGNTASNGTDDNAIYMAIDQTTGKAGDLTFSLDNGGTIYLFDNIKGETGTDEDGEEVGYNVVITGTGTDNKFFLLNDVNAVSEENPLSITPYAEGTSGTLGYNNADLSIGGVSLYTTQYTLSDEVHTYKTNSFTVTGNFDMYADVDFKNEVMDHFETSDDNNGTGLLTDENTDNGLLNGNGHSGTLNVAGMNGLTDTDADRVAVYFAEDGLKMNVTSSAGTVYAPIFTYSANYVYIEKDDSGDSTKDIIVDANGNNYNVTDSELFSSIDYENAGYFVFDKTGFNPAVMATPIAVMGAYNAMGMMFEYNFEHSDYYMKLPEEVRIAKKKEEEEERIEAQVAESDPTKPAYYNLHELTYRGAWSRSFFSNESVDYGGGWDSRDKYYGSMVGFDTDVKVHKNGWANVTTGYAGTMGIRQQYNGGHIKQHGGFVGITETFYKKNFYNAWTIAAGTTKAHEHTMYGHDKDRIDTYGAAGRIGWNFDFHDAKFSLLPTFTASFTYVHPEDFTNAAGTNIHGSGFRAVQLNPNLKFIMNMKNGWQPYLTVGEVWTVGDRAHLYADKYKLPELDLDSYTEYGIGVQKRWAYDRDAYIQFLGHSHGRDGFLINAGIRWNF